MRQWSAALEEASRDAGIAVRQLRHRPLFASAALLTLALGIGANTAIYSLVNAYLVRPFPFPDDDRIAAVIAGPSREPFPNAPRLTGVDWRAIGGIFDATVAWDLDGFTVIGSGQPEYADGAWVSPRYFGCSACAPWWAAPSPTTIIAPTAGWPSSVTRRGRVVSGETLPSLERPFACIRPTGRTRRRWSRSSAC